MKTTRTVTRLVFFALLLGLVSVGTYRVLAWKDTRGIKELYNSPKDSFDVLFIGSSHSFCSVNTAMLWEDFGIAANDISENGQEFDTEYYYLKEALKTQHPKVVFAELRGIDLHYTLINGNPYRNTINMKWSANYIQNADATIKILEEEEGTEDLGEIKKGIILKFPIVHTRYNELTREDFVQNHDLLRYSPNWSRNAYNTPKALSNVNVAEMTESQEETLMQLKKLSEEYGFRLVLWVAPYVATEKTVLGFNAVEKYALENGIDCYNIRQMVEETGFDYKEDMRNEKVSGSHLNCYGAEKITRYIGNLLTEKYGLQDHRENPGYQWFDRMAREWDVIRAAHDLDNAKNLQDYVSALDHSLFETAVIDYGRLDIDSQGDVVLDAVEGQDVDGEIEYGNQINNAEDYDGWFTFKQDYITYPEPGTVRFSASGLTELSYSRVEGPVGLTTENLTGDDEYVLSFEVMSPDWSEVSEPTTEHTGLDAVAFTFVTADDSPLGKQKAYRFLRLGKTQSTIWREVPTATNGEWLKYVSVPLKFTTTDSTWLALDKGLGQYLRVGPSLRANGTVYFRNIRLERADQTNGWSVALQTMIRRANNKQSSRRGLYTHGSYNAINGVWELSDQVKYLANEDDLRQSKLYNGSKVVEIKECDVCVIVVDKANGAFVRKDEFTFSGDRFAKN